ncbi:hypothetical protein BZA77DRAFT_239833 [Pyronema omphalodes]|nr:hypothetical protein BZA77DRAFT_239833 [Pyronema omphalodes]
MDDAASGQERESTELSSEEARLLQARKERPYQYTAHTAYIDLLREAFLTAPANEKRRTLAKVRQARNDMSQLFPMDENRWLEWINDEQSQAETIDERLEVMDLCTRAVTDQVASVKLFKAYADFVEAQHIFATSAAASGNVTMAEYKDLFSLETVVDTYRQGAEATAHDIANSRLLWDKYLDLVMRDLAAAPSDSKIQRVYDMFLARLGTPHANIEETWAAFSQFVTQYDNAHYEKTMVKFNKIYSAAAAKNSEREVYEFPLRREMNANKTPTEEETRIWAEYLEWETSQPKKKLDEAMACALYERCLLRLGQAAKVWEDYVFFLLEKCHNSMPKVISVLQRATRACPWSGTLWSQQIIALEKGFKSFEEVSEVKHKATKTELLDLGGQEELLKVNIAWCGFLRRRAFERNAAEEDLDMAEMGIGEAVTESEHGQFPDPDYRLHRIQINFYTEAKKFDRARTIWKDLSKKKGSSYEYWLRYYSWELAYGTKEAAGNILKRAVQIKGLDWPEKILDVWKTHVEDFGSITEVESMLVKHRRFAMDVAKRRAIEHEQYAQQVPAEAEPAHQAEVEARPKASSKRPRSDADADAEESQPTPKKAKPVLSSLPDSSATADVNTTTAQQPVKRDREHLTIICRNLPKNTPEVKIRQFFRDCGDINSLKFVDGVATVEFDSRDGVLAAQTKDGKLFEGQAIEITVGTGTTLYVTNFPPVADEAYLRSLFSPFGDIVDIRFPSLKYNTNRRFCYIQFSTPEAAQRATSMEGTQLGEKENLIARISAPEKKQQRANPTAEGRELFIRNIDFKITENDIRTLFSQYGNVEKVHFLPGQRPGTHRGTGFLVFDTKEAADAALVLNGHTLNGRNLDVSIAQVKGAIAAGAAKPAATATLVDRTAGDAPAPNFQAIKTKTLGIMNLADTVNEARLRTLFEPYGSLRKVTLRPDHAGALVEFDNVADAGKASLALEGTNIDGQNIEIGDLETLMKRKPEKKVTKGFVSQKQQQRFVPAIVARPGQGPKKRGLGFSGAMSKKTTEKGEGEKTEAKGGKSNEDFKRMFLKEE